jgi:branched-subunit amino acid ABC-type transport system permease component
MKNIAKEFYRRGIIASGFGPIVLAALYLILQHNGAIESLTVNEVCVGIFSLSALAFIAGGMNVIYQIERLPLMAAISIHGAVLYVSYLVTYLVNDWLDWGTAPILVFTGIFAIGYLLIWAIIYSIIKRNTDRINEILKRKQQKR